MTLTPDEQTVVDATKQPRYFLEQILGAEPYDKQIEMAEAVARAPRVSVAGCNGSGKDWTAGRLVMWWLLSRYPAKVIVTGPTMRQVDDIVWNELRACFNNSRFALGGRLFDSPRWELDESHFAVGFSTDNPYSLQGYHSPNLLVVVTEAHALKDDHLTALRRLNPKRIVLTGNPFTNVGEFYDSHHTQRHLYEAITISAFDTPNLQGGAPRDGYPGLAGMVTKQDVASRLEEWGNDSPLYIGGVLGQFPDNLDETIVPLSKAKEAAARDSKAEGPVILGCDVARFGKDKTVVVRRQGSVARIAWRVQGRPTSQIVGWLRNYLEELGDVDSLVVDTVGVGAGVYDQLKELGTGETKLVAFGGGDSAHEPEKFVNATSEVWWAMRQWFVAEDSEADIEDDGSLIGQMVGRGYSYQSDRRVMLESKTQMSKSPDEADALAMTFDYRAVRGNQQLMWI